MRNKKQINNANDNRKLALRKTIDVAGKSVIEFYCGKGVMRRYAYANAKKYVGIDKVDYGFNIVGCCLRAVEEIDVSDYDVIDVDPYGSPYGVLSRIKRIKDRVDFVITDGLYTDLSMGRIEKVFADFIGIDLYVLKKANRMHIFFIKEFLRVFALKHNCEISNFFIFTGNTGAKVKYYKFTTTRIGGK